MGRRMVLHSDDIACANAEERFIPRSAGLRGLRFSMAADRALRRSPACSPRQERTDWSPRSEANTGLFGKLPVHRYRHHFRAKTSFKKPRTYALACEAFRRHREQSPWWADRHKGRPHRRLSPRTRVVALAPRFAGGKVVISKDQIYSCLLSKKYELSPRCRAVAVALGVRF
jgi:hypothetical protein